MISVTYAGADYKHPKSLIVRRPLGTGVYNMVFLRTKSIIEFNGELHTADANTMILFDRYCKQCYYTEEEYLLNDFVHFNIDGSSEKNHLKKLVFNKPFPIEQSEVIHGLMWLIAFEYQNNFNDKEKNMNQLLGILIKKVEEEIRLNNEIKDYGNYSGIITVKNKIMQNPHHNWNIKELAEYCNMSESYFQITYKKLFATTCISDVINARLKMAEELITNSSATISEIAACCGYKRKEHFSRQFKDAYGMSPNEYRKRK